MCAQMFLSWEKQKQEQTPKIKNQKATNNLWRNAALFSEWKDDAGPDSKKEDKTGLGRIGNTCILLLSSQSLESPDAVFIR